MEMLEDGRDWLREELIVLNVSRGRAMNPVGSAGTCFNYNKLF